MKKNIFRVLILIAVVSIGISGCQKDDDNGPGGGANDRDKFLGTWKVIAYDQGDPIPSNYQMTIRVSNSAIDQVLISDFDGETGTTTIASISGNNISIPKQTIGTESVEGSGLYKNGTVELNYVADTGVQKHNITATATR